ncbi:MAG: hypothetical protein ABEJ99_01830 [Candidatus Nanohaloarchaea archaeon]
MTWKAVDSLNEAYEDTVSLLLPFDISTWARLAIILVFAGSHGFNPGFLSSIPSDGYDYGYSSGNSLSFNQSQKASNMSFNSATGMAVTQTPGLFNAAVLAGIVGLVGIFILLFMYLNSVFEFIYYQSLVDEEIRIRKNFRKHAKNGLRYMLFELGVALIGVTAVLATIFMVAAFPLFIIPLLILMLPAMILLGAFFLAVHDFAIPEMIRNDRKLLESVSKVLSALKSEWKEFAIYYLIKVALNALKAVFGMAMFFITLLVLLVPFGIVGAVFYYITPVLLLPLAVIGVLTWIFCYTVTVKIPTETFLYHYALRNHSHLVAEK